MINLICGYTGSGKSEYIKEKIIEYSKKNKKTILLVPEQISFHMEKEIFDILGEKYYKNCEVLSFKRLCYFVFLQCGGLNSNLFTDTQKLINIFLILKKIRNKLKFFKTSLNDYHLSKDILDFFNDCSYCGIDSEKLKIFNDNLKTENSKLKVYDLYLILKEYEKNIETKSDIKYALEVLSNDFFDDYVFFIDEFNSFSFEEYEFLKHIFLNSKEIYISINFLPNDIKNKNNYIFNHIRANYNKIIDIINYNNLESNIIIFDEFKRTNNKSICHIYNRTLNFNNEKIDKSDDIEIYRGNNHYDSLKYIASKINYLIKDKGYRYNDIFILSKDINDFDISFKRVFQEYDIPFFIDKNDNIFDKPIISFIINILKILVDNFSSEYIISYLKSTFLNINDELVFNFENYVYVWSINKNDFHNIFTKNPSGFKSTFTEEEKILLSKIEKLRHDYIAPLYKLKNELKNKTAKETVKLIYNFLENINIKENIQNSILYFEDKNLLDLSIVVEKMWNMTCDTFELLYNTFDEGIKISLKEFLDVFILTTKNIEYGKIPLTNDMVYFSSVDRVVLKNPKIIFVLSCNAENFPKINSNNNILNVSEKNLMKNLFSDINFLNNEDILYTEYYNMFKMLVSSTDKLFITYENKSIDGSELLESKIIDDLKLYFNNINIKTVDSFDFDFFVYNENNLFDIISSTLSQDLDQINSLKEFFSATSEYKKLLENFLYFNKNVNFTINNNLVNKIYSDEFYISPTQFEQFNKCRFSYYLKYILNIKNITKANISYKEIGNMTHYIVQQVIQNLHDDFYTCDIEVLEQEINNAYNNFIIETFKFENIDYYKKFILNNIKKDSLFFIEGIRKELLFSKFKISDMEMRVGYKSDIKPYTVSLNNKKMNIYGVIDRVDIVNYKDKKYIRVIDYKTGNKKFSYQNFIDGIDMQLFLYLFTLSNTDIDKYKNSNITGAFYMPSSLQSFDKKDKETSIYNSFKFSGIAFNNKDSIDVLGNDNKFLSSIYKIDSKNYSYKGNFILDEEYIDIFKNHIDSKLITALKFMLNGDIKPTPINNIDFCICDYCDYKSVCKIKLDNVDERNLNIKKEEFIDKFLKGED